MYQVTLSQNAKKFLKKLDKQHKERIITVLERCRIRPHAHVKRLVNSPYFRLRIGNYRVIMNIKDNKLLILVIKIAHRKEIYKE
ncbi:type II toxin-antitoxin system RelE/ParE family toxin [Candidatus Woesearchaeota archaeon]|nr:type II toxin-antitoxin system RelE/ParE family toxin [Candidatus Woesearchaeota archaeon]